MDGSLVPAFSLALFSLFIYVYFLHYLLLVIAGSVYFDADGGAEIRAKGEVTKLDSLTIG